MAEARDLEKSLYSMVNNKEVRSNITLSELYELFKKDNVHNLRASTLRAYETISKHHILPKLGNVKINNLNVRILSDWKTWVNEKGLSLTTRKSIHKNLNALLNYAVTMEYLPANPLKKIDNFKDPYRQDKDIQFYTPEEWLRYKATALEFARETGVYDYYVFFCLRYYTGARKGEIHALRWNCLDGDRLSIKRSITQKLKGDDVETPPKNKSSIRTIQIPRVLFDILSEHKERQQVRIKGWSDDGFICGYSRPLRDTAIENENKKYARAAGLKHIRIHDFRHSHASLLINAGINALEVAHRLGHSTVDQTLKTYSHLFPNESEKAIAVLNLVK